MGGSMQDASIKPRFDRQSCPICLENFSQANPSVLYSCGHNYHLQCAESWFVRSSRCPVCDQDIRDASCHVDEDFDSPHTAQEPRSDAFVADDCTAGSPKRSQTCERAPRLESETDDPEDTSLLRSEAHQPASSPPPVESTLEPQRGLVSRVSHWVTTTAKL